MHAADCIFAVILKVRDAPGGYIFRIGGGMRVEGSIFDGTKEDFGGVWVYSSKVLIGVIVR